MSARPATRRPPQQPAAAGSPRPAVRDFTGVTPFEVEWDVRPVYDFLFSLSGDAGSTDDLPAADRTWLTDARASLPQELGASVGQLFETDLAIHVVMLAIERPGIRRPADLVRAVEEAGANAIIRLLLTKFDDVPGVNERIERYAQGDAKALPEIEDCLPEEKREGIGQALADPDTTYAHILAVLRAWSEQFAEVEDRVAAMLARDYELRAADRERFSGPDLVERTTGGIRQLPEPGMRRVILAPSYFTRPYNFLFGDGDWRFFGYPIADAALDDVDPLAPPQAVVRLHRALGDETRLRILKLLAGRDLYLTEIAQQLELSKPTIKHHLAILRSAGLVTLTESGTVMYYSLRRDPLQSSSSELERFLVGLDASGNRRAN
jgi:DNA-binding transcriptional ArsR family regulator